MIAQTVQMGVESGWVGAQWEGILETYDRCLQNRTRVAKLFWGKT